MPVLLFKIFPCWKCCCSPGLIFKNFENFDFQWFCHCFSKNRCDSNLLYYCMFCKLRFCFSNFQRHWVKSAGVFANDIKLDPYSGTEGGLFFNSYNTNIWIPKCTHSHSEKLSKPLLNHLLSGGNASWASSEHSPLYNWHQFTCYTETIWKKIWIYCMWSPYIFWSKVQMGHIQTALQFFRSLKYNWW